MPGQWPGVEVTPAPSPGNWPGVEVTPAAMATPEESFPSPLQTAGDVLGGIGSGLAGMASGAFHSAQDTLMRGPRELYAMATGSPSPSMAGAQDIRDKLGTAFGPGPAGPGERLAAGVSAIPVAGPLVVGAVQGAGKVLTPAFKTATQGRMSVTSQEMRDAASAGGEGIAALGTALIPAAKRGAGRAAANVREFAAKNPVVSMVTTETLMHVAPVLRLLRSVTMADRIIRLIKGGDAAAAAKEASAALAKDPQAAKAFEQSLAEAQAPAAAPGAAQPAALASAPPSATQAPTAAPHAKPPGEPVGKPLTASQRDLAVRQLEAAKAAGVDLTEAFGPGKASKAAEGLTVRRHGAGTEAAKAPRASKSKPTELETKLKASLQTPPDLGEIENKIVGLKSLSGLSDAQVAQALRNVYGITPSAGLKMLNMLRAAGRI